MRKLIVLAIVLFGLLYSVQARDIILDWDVPATAGITGFRVYRIYKVGNRAYAKTTLANAPGFQDSIQDGRQYFYFVTVLYGSVESAPSNAIEVK